MAAILVELGDQIINIVLHPVLLFISVSLLSVHIINELAGLFDVVDGQVLTFDKLFNSLLVDGPLGFDNDGDTEPGEDEEPAE